MINLILRLLRKPRRKPPETWEVVGFVDIPFTYEKGDSKIRVLLKVSDAMNRKISVSHAEAYRVGVNKGWRSIMEVEGWLQGGPLPENFVAMQVSDRKPNKLPSKIAHDFNARKD